MSKTGTIPPIDKIVGSTEKNDTVERCLPLITDRLFSHRPEIVQAATESPPQFTQFDARFMLHGGTEQTQIALEQHHQSFIRLILV